MNLSLADAVALVVAPPAAGASEETLPILAGLFLLLLAAKLGEEVFRRLHQPAVIGELLGGFLVGPYALGLVQPGETATILSEIGVVILLFSVGLEIRTDQLLRVGPAALATAIIGVILPIGAGAGYALVTGEPPATAAFVGLALAATSIGITSRVLADRGVLDHEFSRIIIGAAVIDDILSLLLIAIVSGAAEGNIGPATVVLVIGAVGFVLLGFAVARRARGLRREAFTWPLFADTPLVPVFLIVLGLSIVSVLAGLAAIIGAFIAGLIIAETEAQDEIEHEIQPLGSILTPFFFAVTGAGLDLTTLTDPRVAVGAVVLALLGLVTKFLAGVLGARSTGRWASVAVGLGMAPRGEVGIVVVTIGLGLGLLTPALFSMVLIAVVLTTIAAPILLNRVVALAVEEMRRSRA